MGWNLDRNEKLTLCGIVLLGALAILLGSRANAQQTPSDDPPPIPLEAGEAAPYAGDLWSVNRSLRLIFRAEHCREKAELDLKYAVRQFEIDLKFEREKAANRAEADTQRLQILAQALDDASPWYREPWFVALVSSAATVGVIVLTALVLERVGAAMAAFAQTASP